MSKKKQSPDESPKNPTGRPPKTIDFDEVDEYLQSGADGTEVAAILGIHPDTLYLRLQQAGITGSGSDYPTFSAYAQAKRASGDAKLRRAQMRLALSGNVPMLIWLGKQRLGQSEKVEMKHDNEPAVEYRIGGQLLTIASGKSETAQA